MGLKRKVASVSAFLGFAMIIISANLDRILSKEAYLQYSAFVVLAGISLLATAVVMLARNKEN